MTWEQSVTERRQFPGPKTIRDLQKIPLSYGFLPFLTQTVSLLVSGCPRGPPCPPCLLPSFPCGHPPTTAGKWVFFTRFPLIGANIKHLYTSQDTKRFLALSQPPIPSSRSRLPTTQELGTKAHSPLGSQEPETPESAPPLMNIQSPLPPEELRGCVHTYFP